LGLCDFYNKGGGVVATALFDRFFHEALGSFGARLPQKKCNLPGAVAVRRTPDGLHQNKKVICSDCVDKMIKNNDTIEPAGQFTRKFSRLPAIPWMIPSTQGRASEVSREVLLRGFLPVSFISLFGTLIAAAFFFPKRYVWHTSSISTLTSPSDNPGGCWLPAVGIIAAMLLALPFAGYLRQGLRNTMPRLARCAGLAFAFGFVLMAVSMIAQGAQQFVSFQWMHWVLATTAAVFFFLGMLCCVTCAVADQVPYFGGRRTLPKALVCWWGLLTGTPVLILVALGLLKLLGQFGGQVWAEEFRQSFRQTIFWHLAFWEWLGAALAFAFLTGTVLLLPNTNNKPRPRRT
jgi:hypothetical protein